MTAVTTHHPTLGQAIARFARDYRRDDSPENARRTAVMLAIDSLGAACLTATGPVGAKVRASLPAISAQGTSAVIGDQARYRSGGAAWANAVLMHAGDFDDTPHTSHFLAPLLAAAAARHATGEDVVSAWLVSYEVWMALVESLRASRPFNPTSLVAPIAGAVGVARLTGLDASGIQRAMALATASSAGLRGHFGTDAKALDAGRSALAAVQAVELTEMGWTAEDEILEAHNGWVAAFGEPAGSPVTGALALSTSPAPFPRSGRSPHAKAWPCCARHCGALTALFDLLDDNSDHLPPVQSVHVDLPFQPMETAAFRTNPRTGLEARFSVPYVLTAACLDGQITNATFDDESFARVTASELYDSITTHYDPGRAGPDGQETTLVRVRFADGSEQHATTRGAAYLDLAGVQRKFMANATPLLGASVSERALDALLALETADDVSGLIDLFTQTPKEHQA